MYLTLHDLDPRDLAINLRFKGKTVVHPRNKAAQGKIRDAVSDWIEKDWEKWGEDMRWQPPKPAKMLLQFTFPTAANDVDGPVKRTMDAVERGIKQMGLTWNDNQVVDLRVLKYKGEPRMSILLMDAGPSASNFQMREELRYDPGHHDTTDCREGCGRYGFGDARVEPGGVCVCLSGDD